MYVILFDDIKQKIAAHSVPGEIFVKGFAIAGYHNFEENMFGDYFSVQQKVLGGSYQFRGTSPFDMNKDF